MYAWAVGVSLVLGLLLIWSALCRGLPESTAKARQRQASAAEGESESAAEK
jgi:hypothetical protein